MRSLHNKFRALMRLFTIDIRGERVRMLVLGHDKSRLFSFNFGSKIFSRTLAAVVTLFICIGLFSWVGMLLGLWSMSDYKSQVHENRELRKEIFQKQAELNLVLGQLKSVDRFNKNLSSVLNLREAVALKGQGGEEAESLGEELLEPETSLDLDAERSRRFAVRRLYLWATEAYDLADRVLYEQDRLFELTRSRELQLKSTPSIRPVVGYLTSRFGYRADPFTGKRVFHKGIDFYAPRGRPVMSAAPGEVIFAKRWGTFGNVVIVSHGYGLRTLYAHMEDILVRTGQAVDRGDILGTVGNTGRSTSTHLHYEVHINGEAVDPKTYILTRTDS